MKDKTSWNDESGTNGTQRLHNPVFCSVFWLKCVFLKITISKSVSSLKAEIGLLSILLSFVEQRGMNFHHFPKGVLPQKDINMKLAAPSFFSIKL